MGSLAALSDLYPQCRDWDEQPWLDRQSLRLARRFGRYRRTSGYRLRRFVARVEQAETRLSTLSADQRRAELASLRLDLCRNGLRDEAVGNAFAHVRCAAGEVLGMRHFPAQIKGGLLMVSGYLAEMDTGEGKTLTATLAAATAALAGRAVHIVTVNDYLAERDALQMGALYARLGLSTGLVLEAMSPAEKRRAYRADIVYCTSKTLVFDYLRDRLTLRECIHPYAVALNRLTSQGEVMLRGLQFAIVDEADSVLVDEARTPLIISASRPDPGMESYYDDSIALARALAPEQDFVAAGAGGDYQLTRQGRGKLAALAVEFGPMLQAEQRREESVLQALSALYRFSRDVHYIVQDEKVMIVDENTGRVMPDRSWERGLQQLIEVKEGVPVSPPKETLARISFQLFFRRYLHLAGMTGTCREVAGEVADVYGLEAVRLAPQRPSRRRQLHSEIYAASERRWQRVLEVIEVDVAAGRAVLVGTRSILASEHLSGLLKGCGIEHRVLNAKQHAEEAVIVQCAGEPGRVTIATNMAGRGTDIKLSPAVEARGGLHVILTERHDNARVDRQLAGRCARQGDPGVWREILSLEDELVVAYRPWLTTLLRRALERFPDAAVLQWLALAHYRRAQRRVEQAHRKVRRAVLKSDLSLRKTLSFSGQFE